MKAYQKILSLLFFSLSLFYPSCSQKTRVKEPGKIDTLFIEVPRASQKLVIPVYPKGYTSDYIHLFTPQQIVTLDSMIALHEQKTTNEIAIVTIDTLWTTADKFDSLVFKIHNTWGVGKKEKNNGIVIGICPGYRKIRISTGRGLEQKLTDDEAKKIIDGFIIPAFRKGDYFEGTRLALSAIMQEVQ